MELAGKVIAVLEREEEFQRQEMNGKYKNT